MMYLFHELNLILTIYNTVILVRSIIKFLDRNFIFIEKVRFNFNLKRREPSRYMENLSPTTLWHVVPK